MDINFISRYNIESIFDDINAFVVKKYNYNLDTDGKYRKIIKKLTKTMYNSYNNNTELNDINISINEFNKLVLDKSVPFLLKSITKSNASNASNAVSSNAIEPSLKVDNTVTTPIGTIGDNNLNVSSSSSTTLTTKPIRTKRRKKKDKKDKKGENKKSIPPDDFDASIFNSYSPENNQNQLFMNIDPIGPIDTIDPSNNENYDTFLENQDDFSEQIKEANKRIKQNLKTITAKNKEEIFKKEDKIDINRFEKIIENNIENNGDNGDNGDNSFKTSLDNALDNYEGEKINETLTRVLLKQKDYSKNDNIESYKGEEYVGNLIKPIGEQAPIQPLLYQNSSQGAERIIKQTFIIDSGITNANFEPQLNLVTVPAVAPAAAYSYSPTVTNIDLTKNWAKFKVTLIDSVKIDKLCDLYLRSASIQGASLQTPNFVIDIEELNINHTSNNSFLKDKIIILNNGARTSRLFNISYPTQSYYIASLNPSKLKQLTFTLTNSDGTSDDGDFFENVTTITNTSCTTINGNSSITINSTAGLFVGYTVTGLGIPDNSTITSITNITSFVISNNATNNPLLNPVTLTFTAINRLIMSFEIVSRAVKDELLW